MAPRRFSGEQSQIEKSTFKVLKSLPVWESAEGQLLLLLTPEMRTESSLWARALREEAKKGPEGVKTAMQQAWRVTLASRSTSDIGKMARSWFVDYFKDYAKATPGFAFSFMRDQMKALKKLNITDQPTVLGAVAINYLPSNANLSPEQIEKKATATRFYASRMAEGVPAEMMGRIWMITMHAVMENHLETGIDHALSAMCMAGNDTIFQSQSETLWSEGIVRMMAGEGAATCSKDPALLRGRARFHISAAMDKTEDFPPQHKVRAKVEEMAAKVGNGDMYAGHCLRGKVTFSVPQNATRVTPEGPFATALGL